MVQSCIVTSLDVINMLQSLNILFFRNQSVVCFQLIKIFITASLVLTIVKKSKSRAVFKKAKQIIQAASGHHGVTEALIYLIRLNKGSCVVLKQKAKLF